MSHLGSDNETQSPWTWIRASILVPWLPLELHHCLASTDCRDVMTTPIGLQLRRMSLVLPCVKDCEKEMRKHSHCMPAFPTQL